MITQLETIRMVDLSTQYQKIKPAIDRAILTCLEEANFIKGPQVSTFEARLAQYLGVKHVIGCANGTDALQLAIMALDLQPGDEVILPAFTYAAIAEVVHLLHLKPVYVDVDPETFNIDPEQVAAAIGPRTRLVVPVHLFGQCADLEPLVRLCEQHDIFLLEDTAQAIGAQYRFADGRIRSAGTLGELGTTSFFPSKNLGCYGDGGAVFTDSDELARRVRMIANHGQEQKYQHDLIGVNSRLDTLQAAILLEKLHYLDPYSQARRQAAARYDAALAPVEAVRTPVRSSFSTHVFHQYTIQVPAEDRDKLRAYLGGKGIPTMIYYPPPVHRQKAYAGKGLAIGDLVVSEALSRRVLALPMHTELSEAQIRFITDAITAYFA